MVCYIWDKTISDNVFLCIKQSIMLVTYALLTHWTLNLHKKNNLSILTWQSSEIGG